MTGLQIDPNNNIINKQGAITNDTSLLDVHDLNVSNVLIFPNPTQDSWTVKQLPIHCHLELSNMFGQIIWKTTTEDDSIQVPAQNLAIGNYTLTIRGKDIKPMSFLLSKQ